VQGLAFPRGWKKEKRREGRGSIASCWGPRASVPGAGPEAGAGAEEDGEAVQMG